MKINCTHKVLTALFVIYICIEKSGSFILSFFEIKLEKKTALGEINFPPKQIEITSFDDDIISKQQFMKLCSIN